MKNPTDMVRASLKARQLPHDPGTVQFILQLFDRVAELQPKPMAETPLAVFINNNFGDLIPLADRMQGGLGPVPTALKLLKELAELRATGDEEETGLRRDLKSAAAAD